MKWIFYSNSFRRGAPSSNLAGINQHSFTGDEASIALQTGRRLSPDMMNYFGCNQMTEGQHKYGDYYYYARGEITLHTEQQPQSQPVVVVNITTWAGKVL